METNTEQSDDVSDVFDVTLPNKSEYPIYYAVGETVDELLDSNRNLQRRTVSSPIQLSEERFVPAYYKIVAPDGPAAYMNPNSGPHPSTMVGFALDVKHLPSKQCTKEETPWETYE